MPFWGGGGYLIPVFAFDSATLAWVAAVVANGGTVSAGRETLIDALIVGLKSDGVWTKMDRLWLHAGENEASALTDLVADSSATNINSTAFTTDRGYTGQGVNVPTSYIDSNYNPRVSGVNYTQNSAHFSGWNSTNVASSGSVDDLILGVADAASECDIYCGLQGGTSTYFRINDNPSSGSNGNRANADGYWLANRTGASLSAGYVNGASFGVDPNQSSGLVPNATFWILNGNSFGSGSPQTVSATTMGGGLTPTDISNLYSRLRTYMTAVGVP